MKIYTKKGDDGTTSLISGQRVPKYDSRVEAYGCVDELSAQTAMFKDMLHGRGVDGLDNDLVEVLSLLMELEAVLALGDNTAKPVRGIVRDDIEGLERNIDRLSAEVPVVASFTLPGGDVLVSQAHICRTVCRRAERRAHLAAAEHHVQSDAIAYLNRLSDYFYVAGRWLTMCLGVDEMLWKPRH